MVEENVNHHHRFVNEFILNASPMVASWFLNCDVSDTVGAVSPGWPPSWAKEGGTKSSVHRAKAQTARAKPLPVSQCAALERLFAGGGGAWGNPQCRCNQGLRKVVAIGDIILPG